ncbi:MAG: Ig-like domain-containing protein, partial [Lachnospiraceae bacterium]|nr:Ig-like domain-containing protein [Lachnospiraceae bacterium]
AGPIGWRDVNDKTSEFYRKRERLSFDVTILGENLAASFADEDLDLVFALRVNGATYYLEATPKAGTPLTATKGTFALATYEDDDVNLVTGLNQATLYLAQATARATAPAAGEKGKVTAATPYFYYRQGTNTNWPGFGTGQNINPEDMSGAASVTVEALGNIAIGHNYKNDAIPVAQGTELTLDLWTSEASATKTFEFDTPPANLSVDEAGKVTVGGAVQVANYNLVVDAVAGNTFGTETLAIAVISAASVKPVNDIRFTYQPTAGGTLYTDQAYIANELATKLKIGYDRDPSKGAAQTLVNTARLSYEVVPEDATGNYVIEYTSSNPAVATIDQSGLVTVLQSDKDVTISVGLKGTDIKRDLPFKTAKVKYVPTAVVVGSKLRLEEQKQATISNLKVKFRVDGKSDRTIALANSYFAFSTTSSDITVSASGQVTGVKPTAAASVSAALLGLPSVKADLPVVVTEAKLQYLNFMLAGQYVKTVAQGSRGDLTGSITLYEDFDSLDGALPLTNGTGSVLSNLYTPAKYVSREVDLTGVSLSVGKYKENVQKTYTLNLPKNTNNSNNKQRIRLNVTVASAKPTFVKSGRIFNQSALGISSPVTFKVYPGAKVSAVSQNIANLNIDSWSQNGQYITVWVSAKGKLGKSIKPNFTFTTYAVRDANATAPRPKTVAVSLKVEDVPKVKLPNVYLSGEALYGEGYSLAGLNPADYSLVIDEWSWYDEKTKERDDEFTDVGWYNNTGFKTVYESIAPVGSSPNIFEIEGNYLKVKAGTDLSAVPGGTFRYNVTCHYEGNEKEGAAKLPSASYALSINLAKFATSGSLSYNLKRGELATNGLPLTQSQELTVSTPDNRTAAEKKANPVYDWTDGRYSNSYYDRRYAFNANGSYDAPEKYELVWASGANAGKAVAGVTLTPSYTGYNGYTSTYINFVRLSIAVASDSALYGGAASASHAAGTFKVVMHSDRVAGGKASFVLGQPLSINGADVKVTPARVTAFNQRALSGQSTQVAYTTDKAGFTATSVEWEMTNAPQIDDPFNFTVGTRTDAKGALIRYIQVSGTNTWPEVGSYVYRLKLGNGAGIASEDFTLTVGVSKAVDAVVITARASGAMNPYGYNWATGEGMARISFSSNIANLQITSYSYNNFYEVPKRRGAVTQSGETTSALSAYSMKDNAAFFAINNGYDLNARNNYVVTGLQVQAGGQWYYFNAPFTLGVKEAVRSRTFSDRNWHLYTNLNPFNIVTSFNNYSGSMNGIKAPVTPSGTFYRLVDGDYVPVPSTEVAAINTVNLNAASAKDFELVSNSYGSVLDYDYNYTYTTNYATLRLLNDELRVEGAKRRLTYTVMPGSSYTQTNVQVRDVYGNDLYVKTGTNFFGVDRYAKATVAMPRPITVTQNITFTWDTNVIELPMDEYRSGDVNCRGRLAVVGVSRLPRNRSTFPQGGGDGLPFCVGRGCGGRGAGGCGQPPLRRGVSSQRNVGAGMYAGAINCAPTMYVVLLPFVNGDTSTVGAVVNRPFFAIRKPLFW